MSLFWKYRAIFLRYNGRFALGALALVVTNLMAVAIPWLIKDAVNRIQGLIHVPGALQALDVQITPILYQLLGLTVIMFIARVASRYCLVQAGRRIEFDLRNAVYGHLLKMPPSFFAVHPTGELMSRMTNDIEILRMLTSGGVMMGLNTVFVYIATIPAMVMISPKLTLWVFLVYPLVIFFVTRLSGRVRNWYYKVQDVLADISTIAQENFSGIAAIQAYAIEQAEYNRFVKSCTKYFETYRHLIKERVIMMLAFMILGGISYLVVLLIGGFEVIGHVIKLGDFVAFTLYLERVAWPTTAFGWTLSIFQQSGAAIQRIDDVLRETPSIVSPASPASPAPAHGHVEIKNLTFAYRNPYIKDAPDARTILDHITLDIPAGSTVAFVGPIGCGKSTLLRLIAHLYEIESGHIFLDGVDITQLALSELRGRIVMMPQHNFLFSTTVAHNIAYGKPEGAEDHAQFVIPVAEAAGVHTDIMHFPNQYGTLVGERGILLSGGQRQRVSLARALMSHVNLRDACVLVLDDPFSNVDAGLEREIIQAIEDRRLLKDKTTLFATHRFSMVRRADFVVLMSHGRIAETGTHEQLLRTSELYQKLTQLEELRQDWGFEEMPRPEAPA